MRLCVGASNGARRDKEMAIIKKEMKQFIYVKYFVIFPRSE